MASTPEEVEKARTDLTNKLKLVEEMLSKNQNGHKYLLDSPEFTYADARVSPYFVRLYLALKNGHEVLKGISLDSYPLLKSYVENLIGDKDLSKAYNLDAPVKASKKSTTQKESAPKKKAVKKEETEVKEVKSEKPPKTRAKKTTSKEELSQGPQDVKVNQKGKI